MCLNGTSTCIKFFFSFTYCKLKFFSLSHTSAKKESANVLLEFFATTIFTLSPQPMILYISHILCMPAHFSISRKNFEIYFDLARDNQIGIPNPKNLKISKISNDTVFCSLQIDVEVESVMNIKNIEIKKIGEDEASRIFLHTANQTDLIVQEWYIIQKSKLFLTGWREIIDTLKNSDSYKLRNRLR